MQLHQGPVILHQQHDAEQQIAIGRAVVIASVKQAWILSVSTLQTR
jgi:hypothetical protein